MAQSDRDKWNDIYSRREREWREGRELELGRVSSFFGQVAPFLPRNGRALDLAGGAGRHALALARIGLEVTLADISETALRLAQAGAEAEGLHIDARQVDLDEGVPAGPWQVIFVHHFLDRGLIREIGSVLAVGGIVAICQPTIKNLERHQRPSRRFLLREGELRKLLAETHLESIWIREEWTTEDRHEARALARRPTGG